MGIISKNRKSSLMKFLGEELKDGCIVYVGWFVHDSACSKLLPLQIKVCSDLLEVIYVADRSSYENDYQERFCVLPFKI
jgi:hypothetical protein